MWVCVCMVIRYKRCENLFSAVFCLYRNVLKNNSTEVCDGKLKVMSNHFFPSPSNVSFFPAPAAKTKLWSCPSTPGSSPRRSILQLVAALPYPRPVPYVLQEDFISVLPEALRRRQGRLAARLSRYCSTHWEKMSLLVRVWVPEQINRDEKWCTGVARIRERGGGEWLGSGVSLSSESK